MRHLSPERLAAVADERPAPDEAAHLAQCGQCAEGRDAHRRLMAGAALERDRPIAPLSSWSAISAQLRAEGIIRTPDDAATPSSASSGNAAPVIPFSRAVVDDVTASSKPVAVPSTPEVAPPVLPMRRRVVPAWALQVAAGLALVVGGALAGRVIAPSEQLVQADTRPLQPPSSPPTGFIAPVSRVAQSEEFFRSTKEAQEAMVRAEKTYQAAIRYLAANDTALRPPIPDPVEAYRARLAALDDAVAETRKALKLAPTNQALNDYYLTSVNARETTLRQIDDALPVDQRVTRF